MFGGLVRISQHGPCTSSASIRPSIFHPIDLDFSPLKAPFFGFSCHMFSHEALGITHGSCTVTRDARTVAHNAPALTHDLVPTDFASTLPLYQRAIVVQTHHRR